MSLGRINVEYNVDNSRVLPSKATTVIAAKRFDARQECGLGRRYFAPHFSKNGTGRSRYTGYSLLRRGRFLKELFVTQTTQFNIKIRAIDSIRPYNNPRKTTLRWVL